MSTLKDIIQRALGGEQVKVASAQSYEEATTPVYAATETEKLAASLEYLAINLHAIETPAETKIAEFNEFLTKMAQDALVDAATQVPNDYHHDITGGETQAAPVAMSNTVLPMHIPLVSPPGDMSMTAIPTDDAALGEFHESMESPEMEMAENDEEAEAEEAKVAGVLRIYEMLKVASALDNPPTILAPRVDEPGLLLSTPDGLGTPAGGPVMIPEIQSNEAVIGSSARAITQAHNNEMLQYISENGADPTLDVVLDEAKTAYLLEAGARGRMGMGAAGYGVLGGFGGALAGVTPGVIANNIPLIVGGGLLGGSAGAYLAGRSRGKHHARMVQRDADKTASLVRIMGVL
jgi:hypothetical protein